jgi:hypothetical protein
MAEPTFMQGLMSALNAAPSNPLANLGLGLMQAGGPPAPYQNLGSSLMGAQRQTLENQGIQQQLGMGRLNMEMLRARLPGMEAYYNSLGNLTAKQGQAPSGVPSAPPSTPFSPPSIPSAPAGAIDPMAALNTGTAGAAYGMPGAAELAKYPENMASVQKAAETQRGLEARRPIARLEMLASSPNPEQMIQSPQNADLLEDLKQVAPNYLGVHPSAQLLPQNVRAYATYQRNQWAAYGGKDAKDMPDIWDVIPGANGQSFLQSRTQGKPVQLTDQKIPGFSAEKVWNPTTGQDEIRMLQTGPGGAPVPTAALNAASQGKAPPRSNAAPSAPGPGTIGPSAPLGFEKPSPDNLKAANFANYARTNVAQLKKMEDLGYRMSPTVRAAVINAASSEDSGALSQWLSQEMLAHKLTPQDQQYMAALMPVLQASGHSMSGARLTQSQMRTNFESLIPVESQDASYLGTVADNRKHLYNGLLAQSGNAAQMPEFKSTLGADRAANAGMKTAPPIGTIVRGYKYVGPTPKSPAAWQKVSGQ